jgi:hypothetical protein
MNLKVNKQFKSKMNSISFCNGSAFKVDNAVLKEKVFKECESILKMSLIRDYFPGPQPVTVMVKDFEILKKEEYMICEKSDGERHVMLLLNIDNKPMCFLINRNNDLYFVTLSLKKEIFEGSIFDGEIIQTLEGKWNYLIHDCYAYNGSSFMKTAHNLRYAAILDFITKRYVNKESDCFNIKTKLFYKYGPEIKKTWEHILKTTENNIDGLIFTPINEPVKFGRDNLLLKWKNLHTIDLFVKKVGKKINLYGTRKGTNYIFKSLTENEESYKNILSLEDINLKEGVIIEFNYDLKKDIFKPYRIREDKNQPNGEITINNTLKNIEESITIEDFVF